MCGNSATRWAKESVVAHCVGSNQSEIKSSAELLRSNQIFNLPLAQATIESSKISVLRRRGVACQQFGQMAAKWHLQGKFGNRREMRSEVEAARNRRHHSALAAAEPDTAGWN